MTTTDLNLVDNAGSFPKVELVAPNPYGYLLAGAVIDRRPPIGFFLTSRRKRRLLRAVKEKVAILASLPGVREAVVLKTFVKPPGRGALLKKRPQVHIARFDVAIWVETDDPPSAEALRRNAQWIEIEAMLQRVSDDVHVIAGHNARRIGDVDHRRDGVFLLNYFYADSTEQNLAVWEYTAGWFQDQTGLDNSILVLPDTDTDYTVINHCRWDRPRDILPHLLFNRSFRRYVLAHFAANNTAPIPILYRLA